MRLAPLIVSAVFAVALSTLSRGTCFEGERKSSGTVEGFDKLSFSIVADVLTNGALIADLENKDAGLSSGARAATGPKIEPVKALVGD
jgi:hypothetical protein